MTRIFRLILLFIFLLGEGHLGLFTGEKAFGCAKGVVSISFDDGAQSIFSNGFPIMRKYEIPATLSLVTKFIGKEPYYMNWKQVKILSKNGWEIVSHTHTHPELTKLNDSEIKSELDKSLKTLHRHGFFSRTFVSPFGDFDKRVLGFIKKRFSSHRKAWEPGSPPETGFNSIENFNPYYISALTLEYKMSAREIKERIKKAASQRKWLVIVFHSITEKGGEGKYTLGREKLEQIIKFISRLVQAGKLEVKTISQMVKTLEK